jgi:hypothetical protein
MRLILIDNHSRLIFGETANYRLGGLDEWRDSGIGARISAWRHFKGCRADVYRGYHGGLSCRSSLTPRAVITFLVSGIE